MGSTMGSPLGPLTGAVGGQVPTFLGAGEGRLSVSGPVKSIFSPVLFCGFSHGGRGAGEALP